MSSSYLTKDSTGVYNYYIIVEDADSDATSVTCTFYVLDADGNKQFYADSLKVVSDGSTTYYADGLFYCENITNPTSWYAVITDGSDTITTQTQSITIE